MLEVVILSVIILLVSITLLCIRVIFKKNGRFVNTHIDSNPIMRKKGIKCAKAQDFEAGIKMSLYDRIQQEI